MSPIILEKFSATLDWAIRLVLLVAIPAAIALSDFGRADSSHALFYYGEVMTPRDMAMAAYELARILSGSGSFYDDKGIGSRLFFPTGHANACSHRCHSAWR